VRHYEWVRADELPRLLDAVQRAGGNRARAARELGLTARQLNYRLKQLT
jgi:transcriptional regulator with GAF, ATPase, and Fis domain